MIIHPVKRLFLLYYAKNFNNHRAYLHLRNYLHLNYQRDKFGIK